jgi:hypothetical protein
MDKSKDILVHLKLKKQKLRVLKYKKQKQNPHPLPLNNVILFILENNNIHSFERI